jgi:uncharacterized repeat protein (TIGR04138 family)
MNSIKKSAGPRLRYHVNAYGFLFSALQRTQEQLGRSQAHGEDHAHISGPELLEGIRDFGLEQFGLMTQTVFRIWGIRATDDFGRMVFELIERGEMRKTEQDRLTDFFDVYDFEEVFDRQYHIDVSHAFADGKSKKNVASR